MSQISHLNRSDFINRLEEAIQGLLAANLTIFGDFRDLGFEGFRVEGI